jgi:hypothetical protein
MAQPRTKRPIKKRVASKPTPWLAAGVIGILLVIGAVVVLSQGDNDKPSSSGSTQIDPDFTPAVTGAPRVSVSQDYIDYGDVKLGTTVTTTFDVRNIGDQPLAILGEPRVELVEGC